MECTLAPPGDYGWAIHVTRRCGLMSNSFDHLLLLGHIAVLRMYMAYCYRPSSVVCRYVCHTSEPCKNGWTDRDAVWVEDSGGPSEPCIRWGSRCPHGKGQFWGKRAAHYKAQGHSAMSCAETQPVKMSFGMLSRVYPRNPRLRWRYRSPMWRDNLRGKGMPPHSRRHSDVKCGKMAEPFVMLFGLWTQVGWRKH